MKIAKQVTDLIGHTPMLELNRFGKSVNARIIAKLESFNPGGSVKDRIAYNMIVTAEQDGRLKARRPDCRADQRQHRYRPRYDRKKPRLPHHPDDAGYHEP